MPRSRRLPKLRHPEARRYLEEADSDWSWFASGLEGLHDTFSEDEARRIWEEIGQEFMRIYQQRHPGEYPYAYYEFGEPWRKTHAA